MCYVRVARVATRIIARVAIIEKVRELLVTIYGNSGWKKLLLKHGVFWKIFLGGCEWWKSSRTFSGGKIHILHITCVRVAKVCNSLCHMTQQKKTPPTCLFFEKSFCFETPMIGVLMSVKKLYLNMCFFVKLFLGVWLQEFANSCMGVKHIFHVMRMTCKYMKWNGMKCNGIKKTELCEKWEWNVFF